MLAEGQHCDFLPLSEENTFEFLNREKLLRQFIAHYPNAELPKRKLANLLGSSSPEPNEELLVLTSFIEKKKSPAPYLKNSRALALLRNRSFEKAVKVLESVEESKRHSIWHSLRSLIHIDAKQFDAAKKCMEKADELLASHKPGQYPNPYWAYMLQEEIRAQLSN